MRSKWCTCHISHINWPRHMESNQNSNQELYMVSNIKVAVPCYHWGSCIFCGTLTLTSQIVLCLTNSSLFQRAGTWIVSCCINTQIADPPAGTVISVLKQNPLGESWVQLFLALRYVIINMFLSKPVRSGIIYIQYAPCMEYLPTFGLNSW